MRRTIGLLLAPGTVTLANDRIPIDHVGFSSDGGRVRVLSSGIRDGSGFGTAHRSVPNTVRGSVLYQRSRTADLPANDLRLFLLSTAPTPG